MKDSSPVDALIDLIFRCRLRRRIPFLMGIGAGVFASRQCNVELIPQRWSAGRGDSGWTGVLANKDQIGNDRKRPGKQKAP